MRLARDFDAARRDGSDGDASEMTHAQSGAFHEAPHQMKPTLADDDLDVHDRAAAVRAKLARLVHPELRAASRAPRAKRVGMVAGRNRVAGRAGFGLLVLFLAERASRAPSAKDARSRGGGPRVFVVVGGGGGGGGRGGADASSRLQRGSRMLEMAARRVSSSTPALLTVAM